MKEHIVLILTLGVLFLLASVIGGSVYVAVSENKPVSSDVLTLVKMSITGMLGVIAGYVGSSKK